MRYLLAILLLLPTGCEITIGQPTAKRTPAPCPDGYCPYPVQPIANAWAADLPEAMRMRNYSGGSCVHASMEMALTWNCNDWELRSQWREKYHGGEGSSGLHSKADRENVVYASTRGMDRAEKEQLLEWCSRTRRWGVIFYKPSHSICFCGYDESTGEAVLLDNNRIGSYERLPKEEFIRRWHGYGGFLLVPISTQRTGATPPPPDPYL